MSHDVHLSQNPYYMLVIYDQPAFIPPIFRATPVYMADMVRLVLQLYCNIVRATSRHVYESAELRVIQLLKLLKILYEFVYLADEIRYGHLYKIYTS